MVRRIRCGAVGVKTRRLSECGPSVGSNRAGNATSPNSNRSITTSNGFSKSSNGSPLLSKSQTNNRDAPHSVSSALATIMAHLSGNFASVLPSSSTSMRIVSRTPPRPRVLRAWSACRCRRQPVPTRSTERLEHRLGRARDRPAPRANLHRAAWSLLRRTEALQ